MNYYDYDRQCWIVDGAPQASQGFDPAGAHADLVREYGRPPTLAECRSWCPSESHALAVFNAGARKVA